MSDKSAIRAEAARLQAFFAASGAKSVEAPLMLSAATLLDLYGEDIRARAYVTDDAERGEMMLRPDFTVPVVQMHMENGAEPARYTYAGEVFRKQPTGSQRASEYIQVGYELFDGATPARADAEVFALFSEILSPLALRAVTGDMGILSAAIDTLSTTGARKAALRRHIWRPRRFRALTDRYTGQTQPSAVRHALLDAVAQGRADQIIAEAGPEIGLRSSAEVAARLQLLADDRAAAPISTPEAEVLGAILELKAVLPDALQHLRDICVDLPGLTPAVDRFAARLDALEAAGTDIAALPFEASFGRTNMEYYDGFVFGFLAPGRPDLPPVATGGRYDALTRLLGQGRQIPAVGGVVRPDLVLSLMAEATS